MAQFDYLDQVKNRLMEQFSPTSGSANPTLPPNYGQTAPAPDLGMPAGGQGAPTAPTGMENYLPTPETGIPQPQSQPMMPAATAMPDLGNITLNQLVGMGLSALLTGLLAQQSPMQAPVQGGGTPEMGAGTNALPQ
jgi:hypothetical protein